MVCSPPPPLAASMHSVPVAANCSGTCSGQVDTPNNVVAFVTQGAKIPKWRSTSSQLIDNNFTNPGQPTHSNPPLSWNGWMCTGCDIQR